MLTTEKPTEEEPEKRRRQVDGGAAERQRPGETVPQRPPERYEKLICAVTDFIFTVEIGNGRPAGVVAGPGCEKVTGYGPAEFAADPALWWAIVPEEDRPQVQRQADAVMSGATEPFLDHRIVRKDGAIRWVRTTTVPAFDDQGRVVAYDALVSDITEEKEFREQLEHAQKLEAIGQLAGGISHDFNNILTAVLGFADLARYFLKRDHPARPHVEQVLTAGNRARDLVKQILAFSRCSGERRRPLRINAIVKEALKLLRATIPTTISIESKIDEGIGTVMAEPGQIHQIVMNLCTNAAYAMRERGGVLNVRLESVLADAKHSAARLTVADTGPGMPEAVLSHIFEPYFTTKPLGDGSGMGLAVVHGIVSGLSGSITVASEPGVGSTFQVLLPATAPAPAADRPLPTHLPSGSGRLLFVDDEELVVELGKALLLQLGYEVSAHTDSEEALRLFQEHPEQFDLLITDQTMPGMTGAELATAVLRIRPELPVILITGYSEITSAEEARELGIREYLMKPLACRELGETIQRLLRPEGVG